ncbi:MAG: hypothetical protein DMF06_12345 [Verrucomicrobia bacterium]|nr:MAG: hypothetical protein DMF06_12345 [Verrucomicrobiota bacterium]
MERAQGNIAKHLGADILGREVEQFANVPERKRPAAALGNHPIMGIAVEFAFNSPGCAMKAAQVPTGLGQDARGQVALCVGEMGFSRGVHVFDGLVSLVFKKFRTPHFRKFQISFRRQILGRRNDFGGRISCDARRPQARGNSPL